MSVAIQRPPMFVVWEITRRCNLDCAYCYAKGAATGHSAETILQCIRDLADGPFRERSMVVFWTGGEPTLRPDVVLGLAPVLREDGVSLGLCTNGMLLNDAELQDGLVAYYDKITVSLDVARGSDPLRKGCDADVVWASVADLTSRRGQRSTPVVSVAVTLSKFNVPQLVNICNRAVESGVDRIEMRPLQCSPEDPLRSTYALTPDNLPGLEAIRTLRESFDRKLFVDVPDNYLKRITQYVCGVPIAPERCYAGEAVLFIDATLKVYPCCSYFPRDKSVPLEQIVQADCDLAKSMIQQLIRTGPNNCRYCLDMANTVIADETRMMRMQKRKQGGAE